MKTLVALLATIVTIAALYDLAAEPVRKAVAKVESVMKMAR